MPQPTRRMAAIGSGSKDGRNLSTVDVYELASAIGVQFEKMINNHGEDSVTGLMPMVIRVLEHLEEMSKQNETEQAEVIDLQFTVERLQTEKRLKAEERSKFEKELEQIEEMWKNDARNQRDVITRLEDENHRLSQALREKIYDAKSQDEEENRMQELTAQVRKLQEMIQKQREEMRSMERELNNKNTELELLQTKVDQLTRANEEHRRRSSVVQRQAQQLVEDKADLQALIHDKDQEMTRIRNQLKRFSGDSNTQISSSVPITVNNDDSDATNFSLDEVRSVFSERDELQLKLSTAAEELENYQPDLATVQKGQKQINNDELEPTVQGPINREPDEKLHPERHSHKDSGIRRFFKFLLSPSPKTSRSAQRPRSSLDSQTSLMPDHAAMRIKR